MVMHAPMLLTTTKINLTTYKLAPMEKIDNWMSPMSEEKLLQACARIKHVALDMDGTIYMGSTLFPYTHHFLDTLTQLGIT